MVRKLPESVEVHSSHESVRVMFVSSSALQCNLCNRVSVNILCEINQ